MARPLPKGILATATGYRAFVRVKGYPLRSKRLKSTGDEAADLRTLEHWRARERSKLLLRTTPTPEAQQPTGLFRADAIVYLEAVTAMPSYTDRVRQIFDWIAYFGEQPTATITPVQIRAQRDTWLTVGPRSRQKGKDRILEAKPLAPQTVNLRMRALENFFTVTYPGTPNPVRQVPEAETEDLLPRALDPIAVETLFGLLPAGKTRARLKVLKETGIPAKALMRLTAADVKLDVPMFYLPKRKKGKGMHGIALPLTPAAVEAFKELIDERAWGAFSTSSMHSLVHRTCDKHALPRITPYQLRHTFGTNFLAATKDLHATQKAMNHSTLALTLRYAQAAVEPTLAAAFARLAAQEKP